MKWYPNLIQAIISALNEIFDENKQGDKVIVRLLKSQKKWGSRDRKFVSQVLYDIIRWKRLYEHITDSDIKTPEGKWKAIAAWAVHQNIDLPDWEPFKNMDIQSIKNILNSVDNQAILQSVPDWLYEMGQQAIDKQQWDLELQALNQEAPIVLRVNTLKTNKESLKKILLKDGVSTQEIPDYPDALMLEKRRKVTHLKAYQKGLFEIQDASSQLVAPFSGVQKGMTVIDACAGAGGKTLHMASLMQNTGRILAYDIYASKLDELQKRAQRNGVKNIVEIAVISPEIIRNNHEKADILLLDAPCSSLGTLRRKPDLKWKLNPEKIKQINVIQKDIINNYEQMLKPGGYLIYVTCSILPLENQFVVKDFLLRHKNYKFVDEKTIDPSQFEGDGFYMAKLLKTT